MPVENNKNLIKKFYKELWEKGNLAVADELFAKDFINHRPVPGFDSQIEAMKFIAQETNNGLSDIHWKYVGPIAESDMVTCYWEWTAKHTGNFIGVKGDGKSLHEFGIDIFKIKDNKITELWNLQNTFEIMQQLGLIELKK